MTWCFQHAPSKEAIPYDQFDCLGSSPYETEEMKEGKIWSVTYAVENKSLTGTKDKKVPAPAPEHAHVSVPAPSPAPSPAPAGCKGFWHGLDKWRSEEANPSWSSHWRRKSPGGKLSSPSPLSSSPLLSHSVYIHHQHHHHPFRTSLLKISNKRTNKNILLCAEGFGQGFFFSFGQKNHKKIKKSKQKIKKRRRKT